MTIRIPSYVPKHSIRWYVGRLHVSVTDEELAADITQRIRTHNSKITDAQIQHCVAYALSEHHKNQALYLAVQSGRL